VETGDRDGVRFCSGFGVGSVSVSVLKLSCEFLQPIFCSSVWIVTTEVNRILCDKFSNFLVTVI
jgi:hypothetical protein